MKPPKPNKLEILLDVALIIVMLSVIGIICYSGVRHNIEKHDAIEHSKAELRSLEEAERVYTIAGNILHKTVEDKRKEVEDLIRTNTTSHDQTNR